MDKDKQPNAKGTIAVPEVRYNLKSIADKNKPTLISAVFRYQSEKLVYSTRHKITPKHWNRKTHLPIPSYLLYKELKDDLNKITDAIHTIYKRYLQAGDIENLDTNTYKDKLDILLGRATEPEQKNQDDFLTFLQSFVAELEKSTETKYRTAQKYKTLYNNLKSFRPWGITFDSINEEFWKDYKDWRYKNTNTKSQNTLNKDMGCLKFVLRKAHKKGLHTNTIYQDRDFSTKVVKTSIFALNEDEVNKLYLFDFSNNPRLERVRDWFIISCWTALRWSDFSTLKPEHIMKDGDDYYLRKDTIKTDTPVYIPLENEGYSLLAKYHFKGIPISNQKFNDYLKEVFEVAGFTDTIVLKENIQGTMIENVYRKCDIVSAHDGRRTWATINYLKGLPIGLLMQVTGHSQESTFLSYVGASKLDMARALREQMKKR